MPMYPSRWRNWFLRRPPRDIDRIPDERDDALHRYRIENERRVIREHFDQVLLDLNHRMEAIRKRRDGTDD